MLLVKNKVFDENEKQLTASYYLKVEDVTQLISIVLLYFKEICLFLSSLHYTTLQLWLYEIHVICSGLRKAGTFQQMKSLFLKCPNYSGTKMANFE